MVEELTISKSTLLKMVDDARHVELLPTVKALRDKRATSAPAGKRCRPCKGRHATQRALSDVALETGLRQLANYLSGKPAVQRQLKSLLGAKQLRIKFLKGTRTGYAVVKF